MFLKIILERKIIDSCVNIKNIVLCLNIGSILMLNLMYKIFVMCFDLFDCFVDLIGRVVMLV